MISFGTPHRHEAQCASTNDLARDWAQDPSDPSPSGALVSADFQTAGRGQRGRQWNAGFGQSALMSFVYRLSAETEASQLGLVVALSVAEALMGWEELDPRIKWPNDVLLEGRKVSGILIEVGAEAAILGIGVNVNQDRFVGAEEFVYPPTSLKLATGHDWDVKAVVEAVSQSLANCENCWRHDGFSPILEACRARLAIGADVRRGEQRGKLVGLAPSGAAEVRLTDGTFAEWTTVD
jgi:BirA family biotin operon repressor/biotin-[acetyl-CoA-carboxylase] ligase